MVTNSFACLASSLPVPLSLGPLVKQDPSPMAGKRLDPASPSPVYLKPSLFL